MSLVEELNDSDTLVIAATGYSNKLNMSVDAFFRDSGLSCASKIIISDKTKLNTLAGLPPAFPTFESLVVYLKDTIRKYNYKTIITTGTSGGGHTALLLGHLLESQFVVAFAPYPYLSIQELTKQKDPTLHSMSRIVDEFDRLPCDVKKYLDLHNILTDWNGATKYYVHVSKYHLFDYKRALYLSGIKGLTIISHPFDRHSIASALNRHKLLKKMFFVSLSERDRAKKYLFTL